MTESRSRRVSEVNVPRRRRSPVLTAFAATAAALLAIVTGVTVGAIVSDRQDVASPSASPAAQTPAPAAVPTTASPSASPTAAPGPREYASPLGYTIRLPEGWRRSDLQSRATTDPRGNPDVAAMDVFTRLSPDEEQRALAAHRDRTGLGAAQHHTAYVVIDRNPRQLVPRAFAERTSGALGMQALGIEDVTVGGVPGVKITWRVASTDPRTSYALYLPDATRRIWTVGFHQSDPGQPSPPGVEEALRSIVESFGFAAAAASPTPSPGAIPDEPFGIVTIGPELPGTTVSAGVRGERDPRAFMTLGAIGLTSDSRVAGAVSPDGKRFAFWQPADATRAPGANRRLVLWDAADPKKVRTLLEAGANEHGDAVAWSNDGEGLLLAFASAAKQPGTPVRPQYGAIRTYELASGELKLITQDSGGALSPVAWDRRRGVVAFTLLSGSNSTAYLVLRTRGGAPVRAELTNATQVTGSPDATWVVSTVAIPDPQRSGAVTYLRAWPLESPDQAVEIRARASERLSHRGWRPGGPSPGPEGSVLWGTGEVLVIDQASVNVGFGAGEVSLWKPASGARTVVAGSPTQPAALRADGSAVFLATSSDPSRYLVHDLATGRRTELAAGSADALVFAGVRVR